MNTDKKEIKEEVEWHNTKPVSLGICAFSILTGLILIGYISYLDFKKLLPIILIVALLVLSFISLFIWIYKQDLKIPFKKSK